MLTITTASAIKELKAAGATLIIDECGIEYRAKKGKIFTIPYCDSIGSLVSRAQVDRGVSWVFNRNQD